MDEQDERDDNEAVDETTDLGPAQNTARFYFALTFNLAKEDLTKIKQIEEMPVYLVLNTASHIKDKNIAEINELKKLKGSKLT